MNKAHPHPVVGEHGERVQVGEGAQALTTQRAVHVAHKDLCTLVQEHLHSKHTRMHGRHGRSASAFPSAAPQHRATQHSGPALPILAATHGAAGGPLRACGRTRASPPEACRAWCLPHLPSLVDGVVPEAREGLGHQLHQRGRRPARRADQLRRAAAVPPQQPLAHLARRRQRAVSSLSPKSSLYLAPLHAPGRSPHIPQQLHPVRHGLRPCQQSLHTSHPHPHQNLRRPSPL